MPNSRNYVQLIPTDPRSFSVSRIAESENDFVIIQGRIPGEFGFDTEDNVEMHFYDGQNRLVGSVIVPIQTGIISAKTVLFEDGDREEKVVIDMTAVQKEMGLIIPPGKYTVTLNLFSDEIGSYNNPNLFIEDISSSRTELRLTFSTGPSEEDRNNLIEFAQPSVSRVLAPGILGGAIGIGISDIITGLSNELPQKEEFVNNVNEALTNINFDLEADLAYVDPSLPELLDTTIEFLSAEIYDEFVRLLGTTIGQTQFDRLQENEINLFIESAIDNVFKTKNINLFTQDKIRYI